MSRHLLRPAALAAALLVLLCTFAATAGAQPGPLRLTGRFSLSPDHGPAGTRVTARASGMPANSDFTLVWMTVSGRWRLSPDGVEYLGREYRPVEQPLLTVRSGADGTFETAFTVPEGFGFQHDIQVRQGGDLLNQAGFDVEMQVSVTPQSGPPGTPITVEARGIGWRQLQNSWLLSYDNRFTGWLSAVTTDGRARAVIPATGEPGVHVITVLHGDFTFPYLNMQQSPEPDRPMFRIPFTVTAGMPVLPPPVNQQGLAAGPSRAPVSEGAVLLAEPAEGVVGEAVTLSGRGLPPDQEVELRWSTVTGNRVSGSGWEQRSRALATVRTDTAGAFRMETTVPDDLGGAHALTALVDGEPVALGEMTILPSAQPLAVSRGPSGTEVTIHLKGVGWTETANIYHLVYDNAYAGYACGFNSNGDVQIIFRVSGAPGWHFIDLYPGIYKGQETRPLNFRIPQLTYAADHPGERLPAFHYAFLIE